MNTEQTVSVLGAGSFGTAVATAVARSGHAVTLLCHGAPQAEEIARTRENRRFFPGHEIEPGITPTADLDHALAADVLFLAFPARAFDSYVTKIGALEGRRTVVNLIKGLHPEYFTFAELFAHKLPAIDYVALKGPTFARPMFLGELSALTCGTSSAAARETIARLFAHASVALDYSDSPAAIDTVSAVKNVYAVALGISAALGLSENTTFLLVSRIIKEVRTILLALGHDSDVMLTYSGLGDTLLTGFCDTSRNRTIGFMLGRGLYIDTERSGFLAEGVRAFAILRARVDQPLPLLDVIVDILEHRVEPLAMLETLGLRD